MSIKHPIGLLGGTFDPIHNGHLKIAEMLVEDLDLWGMQFIPNKHPRHRDQPEASAADRLAMARIATATYQKFIVNDVEINRPGPSYTIDTLNAIRTQISNQPLCLILGKDAFSNMHTWHEWARIPDLAHLVIIHRAGVTQPYNTDIRTLLEQRETHHINALHMQPAGCIYQYEMSPLLISATQIRKKLKMNHDVSKYLPTKVIRYIHQHHLYI